MPKGFTEHEKELIGKRLLDQGYKMFSAYGLKKTNIEEIARAAGISKGAFYNFYDSKEALFMDVIEEAEKRVRLELLAVIDLPGPFPRARLFAVLKKAFSLFEAIPILQFLTGTDYDLLFRRIPPDKFQQHVANDQAFFDEVIAQCRSAGIPIRVTSEQILASLYPLVLSIMHQEDWGMNSFGGDMDLLLELLAAFYLGEVKLKVHDSTIDIPASDKGNRK
jgi:AcrR family transcriptional regulator